MGLWRGTSGRSVQLASGQRRDERTVSGFIFPLFRRSPRVLRLRYRDVTIDHCCEKCGVQLRAHHRRASIMLAHPPRSRGVSPKFEVLWVIYYA